MFNPVFKRFGLLAATAVAAATLVACGGGGGDAPLQQVASDTTLAVNATVAGALSGTDFTFASGVADLGTSAATTVRFTGAGASPAFSISSGGNTATGTTTFGSCIFNVTSSTFPAGSSLATGQSITVNPCSANFNIRGVLANGVATSRPVGLLLGTASSARVPVQVGVNSSGQLVLSGAIVGNVTLTPVTGATGSF
jgi:hypothetical protein